MLPLKRFSLPHEQGTFSVWRKHDVHTGIDLYCNPDSHVYAIEDGVVTCIGAFTGETAGSPWWHDTNYVIIKGASGYVLYGEISTKLEDVDVSVKEGDHIGNVVTVLKSNKGQPMTMLHLELYDDNIEPVYWKIGNDKPQHLLDPMPIITKELYKYYNKNHKSHEVIDIPEGEWFNISGRGLVMTVNLRKLDPSISISVGDNVGIGNKTYSVRSIEYPSGQTTYAGLVLKEIVEDK